VTDSVSTGSRFQNSDTESLTILLYSTNSAHWYLAIFYLLGCLECSTSHGLMSGLLVTLSRGASRTAPVLPPHAEQTTERRGHPLCLSQTQSQRPTQGQPYFAIRSFLRRNSNRPEEGSDHLRYRYGGTFSAIVLRIRFLPPVDRNALPGSRLVPNNDNINVITRLVTTPNRCCRPHPSNRRVVHGAVIVRSVDMWRETSDARIED
jgi:hypothetical protein